MSRGSKCLIDPSLINYCSNQTYNDELHAQINTYTHLRSVMEHHEEKKCCFYDCHPIEGKCFGLPKKLNGDGSFVLWGNFCSYECAKSFIQEHPNLCNQGREQSLLALLTIKTFGIHFRLERAPNKLLLKMFGGPLEIKEWRHEIKTNRLWVIKTPDTQRTQSTYECFLHHETVCGSDKLKSSPVKQKKKKINPRKARETSKFQNERHPPILPKNLY